ncbi:Glycosyltransferase involved in cell wall bisynthesis [Prevotella sp. khp1]|nr:glycosyltransferase [Xylanibacter ruminicola]SDQ16011.1 Glycosyltransferase involved in cell wall bisynthesis [Prevotella sp. khp1]
MKKALFLIFHGFDPNNGISKKISYQVDALKKCGIDVHLCYMDEKNTKKRIIDGEVIADYGNGILSKILKRTDFSAISNYVKENKIDLVYIRSNHNANLFTINMVKKMKAFGAKVVMEIPTYPYDDEYKAQDISRQIFQDKIFRYQLAKQLDAVVTFSDYDIIFGQRTIKISNGIDFDSVKMKKTINDTTKELNLIGVAEIHEWHGFDRLIKGLAEYYSKPQDYLVKFHVVGYFFSKEIEDEFRKIISDNHMENYVILYGKKHGTELDNLFDRCDFGIGSLGRHRVGIDKIKTLKNREYAARGIPFMYSETDNDFDTQPYVFKTPADESPIDIQQIVDFYRQFVIQPKEIRESIKHLSWYKQMKFVLEDIFPKKRSDNTIRLAYCIPSLNRASGMERVLTEKVNYLSDRLGYDITIITTDNKGIKPFFPLSNKVKIIQLDVNIDELWRYSIGKRLFYYLIKQNEYHHKLEITLRHLQPDITISLLRREINFINDIKDGSKKIGEIHFGRYKYREINIKILPNFINKGLSFLWMRQLDNKIKKLDRFIVLTNEDASYWKGIDNISVIPNPITIHEEVTKHSNAKRVIAVGRYTYQKGFDMLIDAWKLVHSKHPDWTLNIYGPGNKESYEQLIIKNNLSSSITCYGATNNIIKEYEESSIFVFSSRYEGFGLVLAEAMSVGLPCVSFSCPCGPRDIIHDGEDGILCENGNSTMLAEGICKLIEDPILRNEMSKLAKKNIQRYNIDNIMELWHRLFTNIISGKI